jgi:RND family efflux transporter MFP subunit
MQSKLSTTVSLLGTVLIASVFTTSCSNSDPKANAGGPPPSLVQVQTLQNGTLQDSIEYVGTLQAEQTVNLKPQIAGQIAEILVKPGDRVTKGQQIFRLTPNQTTSQVSSAEANVNAAIAGRTTALKQVQAARSQIASVQAQYDLAIIDNTRNQSLARQGAVPRSSADQTFATLRTQAAALQAARDQLGASQAGFDQADANVRKAQADTQTAKVGFDLTRVASPINGSVGDITLKIGDYVSTGQTLTTVNQNDSFDLQIPVPIGYSNQLRRGLTVQLLDPTSGKQLSSGNLYFVSAQASSTSQTIQTRARFPNSNGNLRDAQYVRSRIIWKTQSGVLVPTEAVSPIGGQNFVYVATTKTDKDGKKQGVAHQVPVTLGNIQGQNYQVIKGLSPGDRVIVSGVSKLREGAPITPKENNSSTQS